MAHGVCKEHGPYPLEGMDLKCACPDCGVTGNLYHGDYPGASASRPKALMNEIIKLRKEVSEKETKLRRVVLDALNHEDKENVLLAWDLHLGDFWDCEQSPTGHCVYNRYIDKALDHCLFCGNPAERK